MIFITRGRYTREAMAGMMAKPEDRMEEASKLVEKAGGRLVAYYFTFGEHDFEIIVDGVEQQAWTSALIAVAATGGVTDLRTTVAMTTSDAKAAFAGAASMAESFKAAGA